jgi:SAM-dependent methyltransferase
VARQQGLRRPVAASAIDLPFRDRTFDAVLAAFVVFFFRRYETALHDMVRVLRPGGTMGVTTWGRSEDEFRRAWREVAESFVGRRMLADAHKRGAPWEDRFSDRNLLAEALHQAGLRQIRVDSRRYRVTQSLDDYLAGRETSVTGRFVRDMLGEALWERFRQRVSDEFRSRFPDPIGDSFDVLLATAVRE